MRQQRLQWPKELISLFRMLYVKREPQEEHTAAGILSEFEGIESPLEHQ